MQVIKNLASLRSLSGHCIGMSQHPGKLRVVRQKNHRPFHMVDGFGKHALLHVVPAESGQRQRVFAAQIESLLQSGDRLVVVACKVGYVRRSQVHELRQRVELKCTSNSVWPMALRYQA